MGWREGWTGGKGGLEGRAGWRKRVGWRGKREPVVFLRLQEKESRWGIVSFVFISYAVKQSFT